MGSVIAFPAVPSAAEKVEALWVRFTINLLSEQMSALFGELDKLGEPDPYEIESVGTFNFKYPLYEMKPPPPCPRVWVVWVPEAEQFVITNVTRGNGSLDEFAAAAAEATGLPFRHVRAW